MGNVCCGKADSDNFQSPGRALGAAPPQPERASVPKSRKVGGPPRTLGGGQEPSADSDATADARRRAAEAAEVNFCSQVERKRMMIDHEIGQSQSSTKDIREAERAAAGAEEADAAGYAQGGQP
jgi:hypothetical protein